MKIATMARAYVPSPHPADMPSAPSDIAVALAEGLTKLGHDVTFFGPTGTRVRATQVETLTLPPLLRDYAGLTEVLAEEAKSAHNLLGLWDQYMARTMFERAAAGEYDLLHFHHPEAALPLAKLFPHVPVVYTVHDPISSWFREAINFYASPNQFFVSISNNQRQGAPDLPYIATVHNGIDAGDFAYSDTTDDYLLFCGRLVAEKGAREAIAVAQETGYRLLIIGPVFHNQQDYFEAHVKPYLNEKILYLGLMERENLATYYQKARAMLFPIHWEEPFGLTMIEAMSCGTPVIAFGHGSVPEIIKHGKTGFIVNSAAEMVAAVRNIDQIKRINCRSHVESNFSTEHMVQNYAAAFAKVLKKTRHREPVGAKK
jgi:glycosyltransferase involved in cell wall biosynthesis